MPIEPPHERSRPSALPTSPPPERATIGLVQMEMVLVRRIVIGRQHGREQVAGAVADLVEKAAARPLCFPVAGNADPRSVREREAGNVDGVGRRMLAPAALRAAVEAAAAVAAEMLDGRDLLPEIKLRRGLDDMPFPERQPRRDRAVGAEVPRPIADVERAAGYEAD